MAHKTTIKQNETVLKSSTIKGWVIPFVNEIVSEFPEDVSGSYRVILSTDNKIYTYNELSNVWQLDPQTAILVSGMGVIVGEGNDGVVYQYSEVENSWLLVGTSYEYWTLQSGAIRASVYGALYNQYAVDDLRKITSSDDWDLPLSTDFSTLRTYLGGSGAGTKLKESGTTYWSVGGGTNEIGFNGRGAGERNKDTGEFISLKGHCNFRIKGSPNYYRLAYNSSDFLGVYGGFDKSGWTVRLIRKTTTLSDGESGVYVGNDGTIYRTICIGTQEWLADNLCETKYRNGDLISLVEDNLEWAALETGAMCYYDNDLTYGFTEIDNQLNIYDKDILEIDGENITVGIEDLGSGHKKITLTAEDGTIKEDVVSMVTAGGIKPEDVVTEGTTFTDFVKQLLYDVFYPTYSPANPTATLTGGTTTQETGYIYSSLTLTLTYNRNSILGALVAGIWQPLTFQNYRSGAATKYIINTVDMGLTNQRTISNYEVTDGSNTFTSEVQYAEGAQPTDSEGNNYQTPLAAGNLTPSRTIYGRRRMFYGVDGNPINSAGVRALTESVLNPSAGTKYPLTIPINSENVCFAYPKSLGQVTSIWYYDGNMEVKGNFVETEVSVEGLNGLFPIDYYVYVYTPVEPFPIEVDYIITI